MYAPHRCCILARPGKGSRLLFTETGVHTLPFSGLAAGEIPERKAIGFDPGNCVEGGLALETEPPAPRPPHSRVLYGEILDGDEAL